MNKISITNITIDGNGYTTAQGSVVVEFEIGENGYGTIPKIDADTLRGICVGVISGMSEIISNTVVGYNRAVIPTPNSEFKIDPDSKLCSCIKD